MWKAVVVADWNTVLEFAVETEDDHETRFVPQFQTRNWSANVRNSIESWLPQPLDNVDATSWAVAWRVECVLEHRFRYRYRYRSGFYVLFRGFQTLLQMPLAYQNMECDLSVVPSCNIRSVTYLTVRHLPYWSIVAVSLVKTTGELRQLSESLERYGSYPKTPPNFSGTQNCCRLSNELHFWRVPAVCY
jgi:hypothetical protein